MLGAVSEAVVEALMLEKVQEGLGGWAPGSPWGPWQVGPCCHQGSARPCSAGRWGCGSQPRRVRCPWAPPLPSLEWISEPSPQLPAPQSPDAPLSHAHCALLGPMAGAEPQTEKRNRALSSGALARKQGPGLQVSSRGPRCGQDAGWALPLRVHPGGQAGQRGTCPDSSLKWEDTSHEDGLCGRTRGGDAGNGV